MCYGLFMSQAPGLGHEKATSSHRFARELPTIPPLPFRRGEGRGEGSDFGLRDSDRVRMSGELYREAESHFQSQCFGGSTSRL